MRERAKRDYSVKRIIRKLCMITSKSQILYNGLRIRILRWGGVKIGSNCFIGSDVSFDGIRPDLVEVGNNTLITSGCKILTHFFDHKDRDFYYGTVSIGSGVFIGMNTLIVNSITIGDNVIIAAGSVVTKDIPSNELWGGVPAKYIKTL